MRIRKKLKKQHQLKLLSDLYRLAKAGLKQAEVAQQLILFGSKTHKKIGREIHEALISGGKFAEGLKPWIDPLAWETLLANETTGNWAKGLENAKLAVSTQNAATGQLFGALLFPIIGLITLFALAAANATQFLPMFEEIIPQARWGMWTNYALGFGQFSAAWGSALVMSVFVFIVFCLITLPFFTGAVRKSVDNFPLYRQYRLIQISTLLRSMSDLSQAGFGLKSILIQLKENTSPYLRYHVNIMLARISEGETNLGNIMNTGILNLSEQYSMRILGQIDGSTTTETLRNSTEIHHDLLMSELNIIKKYGADAIKIAAAIIGLLMAGGIAQLLLQITTTLR